ncbi:MAG: type IV pilus twitching motility protein PilT, partial [Pseudomonadota bacterium]
IFMSIAQLIKNAVDAKASDLHLSANMPPIMRIHGNLKKINHTSLELQTLDQLLNECMNEKQKTHLNTFGQVDFSLTVKDANRVRINIFKQQRGLACVIRLVPSVIPNLESLNLPMVIKQIAAISHGLVLVVGPTGCGKSTTLAAIIDYLNENYPYHIVTLEDPIEFLHHSKHSLIHQREVSKHAKNFNTALRGILRADPDVIMIGELRDLTTIRLALTAAETGHRVFATLHTAAAAKAIHRIIDVFPGEEKNLIRAILASSLQAVIAQKLIKTSRDKRIAVCEIMRCNTAIRNLIKEDKLNQIYSAIQTGQASGMMTFDQHLSMLHQKGVVPVVTQV